jgi:acyl-CoA synthetase (AMP-forming)/AMP-acid ligase II
VATALVGRGLRRGDRVGLLMLISARHFELWYAIPSAGLVMNDLNFRLAQSLDDVLATLERSGLTRSVSELRLHLKP